MIYCPVCGGRGIGKVGINQYYCQDCYVEFMMKGDQMKIYTVQDDGTLLQYQNASVDVVANTG